MKKAIKKPKAIPNAFSEGPSITKKTSPELHPVGFYVILKPKPPRKKIGLLETATRTQKAQMAVLTQGQIVAIGALAWNKTGDVDYTQDPIAHGFKIGDWVKFRKNSGQREYYGDMGAEDAIDNFLITVADSDILAKIPNKDVGKFYDWAG